VGGKYLNYFSVLRLTCYDDTNYTKGETNNGSKENWSEARNEEGSATKDHQDRN
jgi:hypothetical protein